MSLINRLIHVTSNEKSCDILLPHEEELMNEVKDLISRQSERIRDGQDKSRQLPEIQQKMYQAMELELLRWKYLVRTYYSVRFQKITTSLGKTVIPIPDNLYRAEAVFCEEVTRAITKAFHPSEPYFTLEDDTTESYVFFIALKNVGSVLLSQEYTEEEVELAEGSVYFAKFKVIKKFLQDGSVQLI